MNLETRLCSEKRRSFLTSALVHVLGELFLTTQAQMKKNTVWKGSYLDINHDYSLHAS